MKNKAINKRESDEQIKASDPCRILRSTAITVAGICLAAALIMSALIFLGVARSNVSVFALVGGLAGLVGCCAVTMMTMASKCSTNQKQMLEDVSKRIRGAAAGDADAAEEDAYDYAPVDNQICESLSAVITEINATRTDRDQLASRLEGISEERDEFQFRMLGARMVPGMIERAIRKIGRVADQRKINDISAFSHNLCDLMNSSLQAAKKPISLAAELGLIRTYLDLDDAITGRKTEYRMTVMCSIVGYKLVPHLILPVVENLLEYSERDKSSKYEVAIEITTDQNNMYVVIKDNGRGIDVDTLEKLQNNIATNAIDMDDDPLSLPGIHRRIGLCYGEPCGLEVTSSMLGTSVRLTLPPKPEPVYDDEY